ncbi:hypothetical protein GGS26DRAFT_595181 [Hypomontagnella submonticulosa]|nr:hypothetical protein GGS26DRAFT_595181 [Hypomontagnella submonticulosa]
MPSAQPTCAARVIQNSHLKYGWGATLSPETNAVVRRVKNEAGACYQMQISRDRPISSASLHAALFWEHRHLIDQLIVSTPSIEDDVELFSHEKKHFKEALARICRIPGDSRHVQIHPLFGPMRDRSFTLWPIRVDGNWVTIILQVEQRRAAAAQRFQAVLDREVTKCAIVDPWPKGRRQRRAIIEKRLPKILAEGCINLPASAICDGLATADIGDEWATGHVAYAVCREFLRRLRVLLYRRNIQVPDPNTDFLWTAFEEDFEMDVYRQSIMTACAHQTIEKSGYLVRLALEVPSEKSGHNPDAISHIRAKSITPAPEEIADELYTKTGSSEHLTIEVPEQDQAKAEPEKNESEESELGYESDSESEMDGEDDSERELWEQASNTFVDVELPPQVVTTTESDVRTPETLEAPTFQPTVWGGENSEPAEPGVSFDPEEDTHMGNTPSEDGDSINAPWTPSSPRSPRSRGEPIYTESTTEEITVSCGAPDVFDGEIVNGNPAKRGLSDDEEDIPSSKRVKLEEA